MVNYLNHLGLFVDLHVVFEQKNSELQKTRWNNFDFGNFTGHVLNGIPISKYGALSIRIITFIKRDFDFIFVTNPLTPSGIISILYMKLKKYDYVIESEGGFPGSGKGVKEIVKKIIFSKAHYYFSGNGTGDEYLQLYGSEKNKIHRYPFSSVFESDIIEDLLSKEQKKIYRIQNNIEGERAAVGIGRLVESKNWEWLIDAWTSMKPEHHLYIIGEGPLKETLTKKIVSLEIKNVHITDYINHKDLLNLMTYFDLLVHPTLSDVWGLTINEGMARGLPIVSTPKCLAALEMIDEGLNGFLSNPNESFINKVNLILSDDDLSNKISNNNKEKIRKYTIEQMVKSHLEFFKLETNS